MVLGEGVCKQNSGFWERYYGHHIVGSGLGRQTACCETTGREKGFSLRFSKEYLLGIHQVPMRSVSLLSMAQSPMT